MTPESFENRQTNFLLRKDGEDHVLDVLFAAEYAHQLFSLHGDVEADWNGVDAPNRIQWALFTDSMAKALGLTIEEFIARLRRELTLGLAVAAAIRGKE